MTRELLLMIFCIKKKMFIKIFTNFLSRMCKNKKNIYIYVYYIRHVTTLYKTNNKC